MSHSANKSPCRIAILLAILAGGFAAPATAGEADVENVVLTRSADGSYRIDVTVRHADAGWEHYADKWQVLGADGTVYGERVLLHPHDSEQPFTRSQSGIVIPDGVSEVRVRAQDRIHGFGGKEMLVRLDKAE